MIEKIFDTNGSHMAKKNVIKDDIYLVEVSIGPSPKEFISDARKIRDISISSFIISMALRHLLDNILQKYTSDIFLIPHIHPQEIPSINNNDNKSQRSISLPNRCVFVIDDLEFVKNTSFSSFYTALEQSLPKGVSSKNIMEQLKNVFSHSWVALKINKADLGDNFKDKLKKLQELMLQRKITRDFTAWEGSEGSKCKVCFKREVVITKKDINSLGHSYKHKFKEDEEVCSICLIKRIIEVKNLCTNAAPELEKRIEKFDSVSDVSSAFVLNRFDTFQIPLANIFKFSPFPNKISQKGRYTSEFPGVLLYPETYIPENFIRELKCNKSDWDSNKQKQASTDIIEALAQVNIKNTPSYYVILRMDADDMGKWMSGAFHQQFSSKTLQQMSRTLRYLAEVIYPYIVEKIWKGKIIFSSGDELLAFGSMWIDLGDKQVHFLDIAYLLYDCFLGGKQEILEFYQKYYQSEEFENIATLFQNHLSNYCQYTDEETSGFIKFSQEKKKTTMSCGMAIVHHTFPLNIAINQAYATESLAKNPHKCNKDAWAISINVRSGSTNEITGKWYAEGNDNQKTGMNSLINTIVNSMSNVSKEKCYGFGLLQDLRETSQILLSFQQPEHTIHQSEFIRAGTAQNFIAMLKAECERFCTRHQGNKNTEQETKLLSDAIMLIFEYILLKRYLRSKEERSVQEWFGSLAFLIREKRAIFLQGNQ